VIIPRAVRSRDMILRLGLLAACVLGAVASPAEASCIRSTERERVSRADAVFTGRVLSVSSSGRTATFRVLSVRKGRVRKGASVRVSAEPFPSSVTIDWNPRRGQRWRVYTDRKGTRWITNDCMGTRRV